MINEVIAKHFNVTVDEMLQKSRKRKYKEPRHISMYFHKEFEKLSSFINGEIYGQDHATVLNGIKRVNNYIDTDKRFKAQIEHLRGLIEKEIENRKLAEEQAEKERLYQLELEKLKSEPEFFIFSECSIT